MNARLYLLIAALFFGLTATAQDNTVLVEDKLTPDINVKFHVLKTNRQVNEGLYQAFYKKKNIIASGSYSGGKPTGLWHFYSKTAKPIQLYNYTTQTLRYEAPDDSTSNLRYFFDQTFNATDTVTKPIRIGGTYYGYLPYLNLFRLPQDFYVANPGFEGSGITAYMELLVSPAGRLADYRVHIASPIFGERVLAVKIDKLSDEDKTFFPATFNGQPISSRIAVICRLTTYGRLEL